MTPLLQAGLGNALAATALAAGAYLAARARVRPAVAHALWLLVLVKLLTPPLVPVPVAAVPDGAGQPVRFATVRLPRPVSPARLFPEPAPGAVVLAPVGEPDGSPATRGMIDPKTGLPLPPKAARPTKPSAFPRPDAGAPAAPGPDAEPAEVELTFALPPSEPAFPWWQALAGVWLLGAAVVLVLSVRRVRNFRRFLRFAWPAPREFQQEFDRLAARMGLARPPRLRLLPGAVTPMVWAVGRATVYFPAGLLGLLTPEQRQTLLAHELAHLRRRDHWVRWVELAAASLYWWLPVVWLARRGLHQAEEECCDAAVVETLPAASRSYAAALLDTMDFLAEARPAPAMASGLGEFAAFRQRLVLILGEAERVQPGRRVRLAVTAAACVALPLAPTLARVPPETPTPSVAPAPPPAPPVPEAYSFGPAGARVPAPREIWQALTCSPDGRLLALGGEEGVVTVWDLRAGKARSVLRGHRAVIAGLAFSPDGRLLASGGADNSVRVWDVASASPLYAPLTGHAHGVSCVAFSPDGLLLASGSLDRTVRVWRVASGELAAEYRGHTGSVRSLAFSPDCRLLASASADYTARVWDLLADRRPLVLRGHRGAVRSVAFQPAGRLVVTGGEDGTVRVWSLETGLPVAALSHPDAVAVVTYTPTGGLLLTTTLDGRAFVWDARTGRQRGSFQAHAGPVSALGFPRDGLRLYSAGRDRAVRQWAASPRPTPEQLAGEGKWWLGLYHPVARWLSLDEERPGAIWPLLRPATPPPAVAPAAPPAAPGS